MLYWNQWSAWTNILYNCHGFLFNTYLIKVSAAPNSYLLLRALCHYQNSYNIVHNIEQCCYIGSFYVEREQLAQGRPGGFHG